jgi:Leucine-rich repeat (LRR) protein
VSSIHQVNAILENTPRGVEKKDNFQLKLEYVSGKSEPCMSKNLGQHEMFKEIKGLIENSSSGNERDFSRNIEWDPSQKTIEIKDYVFPPSQLDWSFLKEASSLCLENCQNIPFSDIYENGRHLTLLSLTSCNLEDIPTGLKSLTEIKVLYLDHNKFTRIPEEVFTLSKAEILYMENNLLKEVSPKIAKLKKLHAIDLRSNLLSSLPNKLNNCLNWN